MRREQEAAGDVMWNAHVKCAWGQRQAVSSSAQRWCPPFLAPPAPARPASHRRRPLPPQHLPPRPQHQQHQQHRHRVRGRPTLILSMPPAPATPYSSLPSFCHRSSGESLRTLACLAWLVNHTLHWHMVVYASGRAWSHRAN